MPPDPTPAESATLERTRRFQAAHRYHRTDWSEARNREAFGDLNQIHRHDYAFTVWVTGPMDPATGFCVDLVALDELLDELVERLDERLLNTVIPEVRSGARQPSCEVIARWIFRDLEPRVPPATMLARVRVAESQDLAAIWPGIQPPSASRPAPAAEEGEGTGITERDNE